MPFRSSRSLGVSKPLSLESPVTNKEQTEHTGCLRNLKIECGLFQQIARLQRRLETVSTVSSIPVLNEEAGAEKSGRIGTQVRGEISVRPVVLPDFHLRAPQERSD